jgi:hypothetical protein
MLVGAEVEFINLEHLVLEDRALVVQEQHFLEQEDRVQQILEVVEVDHLGLVADLQIHLVALVVLA